MKNYVQYFLYLLLLVVVLCFENIRADLLPTGGQVVSGDAAIAVSADGTTMNINQSTQNVAIDFDSYNISAQNAVNYNQPNPDSVALNRITGQDPTEILGALNANGIVYLMNPNGIVFGDSAQVNVNGLVAASFMDGTLDFDQKEALFSQASGSVINQGTIVTETFAVLSGKEVENHGSITAHQAALLSGDTVHIDSIAGGGVFLMVEDTYNPESASTATSDLSENENTGIAPFRDLDSTAQAILAANPMFTSKVVHTGEIHSSAGTIEIRADNVELTGAMNTSGAQGGDITVSGEKINLTQAQVDAAGETGDGTVTVESSRFFIEESDAEFSENSLTDSIIENLLNVSGNVVLRTTGTENDPNSGDMVINASIIAPGSNADLKLEAANDIILNAEIDFATTESEGDLILKADGFHSNSKGAIINNDASISMGAGGLLLSAGSGIGSNERPLETQAGKLDLTNTNSNGIFISNKGALQLSDLDGDNYAQQSQGVSVIKTNSPLIVDANIVQAGDITLQALGDGGGDDDLTITNNVTQIESTDGGTIRLEAGDDVVIEMAEGGFFRSDADGNDTIIITASNGQISQSGGSVETDNLALRAMENIDFSQSDNDVDKLAVAISGTGILQFKDIDDLVIGSVDQSNGIIVNAGSMDVETGAQLDIDQAITAGTFIRILGNQPIVISGVDLIASNINLGNSPVELDIGPVTLQTQTERFANTGISINGAITSASQQDLTIDAGASGFVTFNSIGGAAVDDNEIGSLDVTGQVLTRGDVRTMGAQTYNNPIFLADNDIVFDAADADIRFNGDIQSLNFFDNTDLTVKAGTGGITFGGIVGSSQFADMGDIDIDAATIEINGSIQAQGNLMVTSSSPLIIDEDLTAQGEIGLFTTTGDPGGMDSKPFKHTSGTISSANGSITIVADDMDLQGTMISAGNDVSLRSSTAAARAWVIGDNMDSTGTLELSEAELVTISTGTTGELEIGASSTVFGRITTIIDEVANIRSIRLSASTITDEGVGGFVFAGPLNLETVGNIDLNSGNHDIDELSVSVTNADSVIAFSDSDDLLINNIQADQSKTTLNVTDLTIGDGAFQGNTLNLNISQNVSNRDRISGNLSFDTINLTIGGRFGADSDPINVNSQTMIVKASLNPVFLDDGIWVNTTGTVRDGGIGFNAVNGSLLGIGLLNGIFQFGFEEVFPAVAKIESDLVDEQERISQRQFTAFQKWGSMDEKDTQIDDISNNAVVERPENWPKIIDVFEEVSRIEKTVRELE